MIAFANTNLQILLMNIPDYRQFDVWPKSRHLILHIYQLTDKFSEGEWVTLSRHIRSACVAIPNLIADGFSKSEANARFALLQDAVTLTNRLENQLSRAHQLKLVEGRDYEDTKSEVLNIKRMLIQMLQVENTN